MAAPYVSIIVPTRNSEEFLRGCLESIRDQTFTDYELIVVDRDSTDATKQIAREFTELVFNHGPERSAQVNFGVTQASGEFVYKVDSDFVLDPEVLAECVAKAAQGFDAVVVHNSPDPSMGWISRIHAFELAMYKYDLKHSSARFVRRSVYQQLGGFDEKITAGEDYDFQARLNRAGITTGFVEAEALHKGEPKNLVAYLRKCYGYGKDAVAYQQSNPSEFNGQMKFKVSVWLVHRKRFLSHPVQGAKLLLYYLLKFSFAGAGFVSAKLSARR